MWVTVIWTILKKFIGGVITGIVDGIKWLIAHPHIAAVIIALGVGFLGGHWWESRSANKQIAALQKQSDDYFQELAARKKEIEENSKTKADELVAAETKGKASADLIVSAYRQALLDATDPKNAKHTITTVACTEPDTPKNLKDQTLDVMIENGQVVATRFPQVTIDKINELIKSSNNTTLDSKRVTMKYVTPIDQWEEGKLAPEIEAAIENLSPGESFTFYVEYPDPDNPFTYEPVADFVPSAKVNHEESSLFVPFVSEIKDGQLREKMLASLTTYLEEIRDSRKPVGTGEIAFRMHRNMVRQAVTITNNNHLKSEKLS